MNCPRKFNRVDSAPSYFTEAFNGYQLLTAEQCAVLRNEGWGWGSSLPCHTINCFTAYCIVSRYKLHAWLHPNSPKCYCKKIYYVQFMPYICWCFLSYKVIGAMRSAPSPEWKVPYQSTILRHIEYIPTNNLNPIYLRCDPICPQDIFYSISLVFRSPVSFPVEYSMQIIHRFQRKQKCKILASQTFLITIL